MSLKYEPASEPLHISDRGVYRLMAEIVLELCVVALAQEVQEPQHHLDVRV